jgi:transglutaminase-like putative cysteine protease
LELRSRRDLYMTVFLGYFVVVTQFLFAQGLPLAVYLAAVVLGLTAVLNAMNRADPAAPLVPAFGLALRLLGAAVPAMLVLFVLFPRLGGPLWGVAVQQAGAVTGMSDQISPGTISRLSQSRETAFRVRFEGQAPPPAARYWRGLVLWDTDGRTWTPGPPLDYRPDLLPEPTGRAVAYELTLEPTRQRYLFLLDLPRAAPPDAVLAAELTARAREQVTRRLSYRAEAWPEARPVGLDAAARERGLWLPHTVTPRMEELVAKWRDGSADDAAVVQAALAHFRTQPFVYTLAPPALGEFPEDQFLFETRSGFCEHYATSFTLLMRIAGIPARVVVGYQGGEYNPRGEHWIVRQSDAHAWSEVWLPGQGWTRVDPTAAVAPERIDYAIGAAALAEGAPVIFQITDPGAMQQLLREVRWLADTLELGWHHWVVGFSRERQLGLLDQLGLGELAGYGQALLAVALGIVALGVGRLLLQVAGGGSDDPLRAAYTRLQHKLARAGLTAPPWLGPRDLQQAAVRAFPEHGGELQRLFGLYIGLRYGRPVADRRPLRRFRRGVRWLRLRKDPAPRVR